MALEIFRSFLRVFTTRIEDPKYPPKEKTTKKRSFVESLKLVKIDKDRKYAYLGKSKHHPEDGMALYCVL